MKIVRRFLQTTAATRRPGGSAAASSSPVHVLLNEKLLDKKRNAHDLEKLVMETAGEEFNEVNCATAVSVLAKSRSRNKQCAAKLLDLCATKQFAIRELTNLCHGLAQGRMVDKMPDFVTKQVASVAHPPPRAMANILWSFATLHDKSQCQRFAKILAHGGMRDYNAQDVSNTMWSFAHLRYISDSYLNRTFRRHLQQMDLQSFTAQGISNTLWAFASMEHEDANDVAASQQIAQKFAKELMKQDQRKLSTLLPKHLATNLWALATLGLPPAGRAGAYTEKQVADAFAMEILSREHKWFQFSSQDLAQLCWAFSKWGEVGILPKLAKEITRRGLQHFNEQDVTSIVWAFANADVTSPTLFQLTTRLNTVGVYDTRAISTLLWSFAKLEVPNNTQFVDRLCARALKLDFTSSREQAMVLWALGKMRHESPAVCKHICDTQTFTLAQDVSNTVLSLATLNYTDTAPALAAAALEMWQKFTYQDVINTAWGFACMGPAVLENEKVRLLFELPLPEDVFNQNTPQVNQQIAQIRLALGRECGLLQALKKRDAVLLSRAQVNDVSKVHMLVHDMLKPLLAPREIKFEYELAESLFVDMYLLENGVVIEVDGPLHFFSNHPQTPTGKSLFRDRLVLSTPNVRRIIHINSTEFWNLTALEREARINKLAEEINAVI